MVLETLQELADPRAQEEAWIDKGSHLLPSPTEIISQLFDDSGLGDLLKSGRVFSVQTDRMLRELSEAADAVDLEQPPRQLLDDLAWGDVQARAAQALSYLKRELEP